jgi:hypothetical protein
MCYLVKLHVNVLMLFETFLIRIYVNAKDEKKKEKSLCI